MPCYDPLDNPKKVQKRANEATRAACEMAVIVRKYQHMWGELSIPTQNWIRKHEDFDRKRNQ